MSCLAGKTPAAQMDASIQRQSFNHPAVRSTRGSFDQLTIAFSQVLDAPIVKPEQSIEVALNAGNQTFSGALSPSFRRVKRIL